MLPIALSIVVVTGILLALRWRSRRTRQDPQGQDPKSEDLQNPPQPLLALWPVITLLVPLNRLLPLAGIKTRYAHQVERAGLSFDLSPDEFLAIKEITTLLMTATALLVYATIFQNWLVIPALCFIGFILPDVRLSAAVKKRQKACLRTLPGFLDLLALAVEAGLGFESAIRKLTEVLEPGPLISVFQSFLQSMNLGKPRTEALIQQARKLDLPDFTAFANSIVQATETGASMGPVLRTESGEMLFRRFERAEKAGYELPVKILFPLFAFVFPATFLMILGPLYFQFKASGAAGAF